MSRRGRPTKRAGEEELEPGRKRLCIVHKHNVPYDSPFTFLTDLGGDMTQQRLEYLHGVRDTRLKEKPGSATQQLDICSQIPDHLTPEWGYHRQFYSSFTSKSILINQAPGK